LQPDDSLGKSSVVADPLTEGIHKDTNGPDKASDSVEDFAHLPGRRLCPCGCVYVDLDSHVT